MTIEQKDNRKTGYPNASLKDLPEEIEEIRESYRQYWRYMILKDISGLNEIMSDDYELHHMTGLCQKKEDFFRSLQNGQLSYYSAIHEEILVKVHDDIAEMTGKSLVEAAVYGGGKHSWRLQGDFILKKEKGSWKYLSCKVTTY